MYPTTNFNYSKFITWLWTAKLRRLAVIFYVNLLITQHTYLKSKSSFGKEHVKNTQIVFEICMIVPFSSSCFVREVLKVVLCLYDVAVCSRIFEGSAVLWWKQLCSLSHGQWQSLLCEAAVSLPTHQRLPVRTKSVYPIVFTTCFHSNT